MPPEHETRFGVYIHWPFCRAKCPYCDFNSHVRDTIDHAAWRDALVRELDYLARRIGPREVTSVFFGGGTPSLMVPDTVDALLACVAKHWALAPDCEITLEANPTSSEAKKFESFHAAGVNRLSLGMQSLDSVALKSLGREHDVTEALKALEWARAQFPRVSFDLIYARPEQKVDAWEQELRRALELKPDHLSLYQLTIEPGTPFHRQHAAGSLVIPASEEGAAFYDVTQSLCDDAGLPAYEISNHARAGYESRHNLTYWRGQEYAGIGPGAHGRIVMDGDRYATQTTRAPEAWLRAVVENGNGFEEWQTLSPVERAEEVLLMGMRLCEGVPVERISALAETALDPTRIDRLVAQNLIERRDARLIATPQGRLVLNALIAELARERVQA